MHSPLSPSPAPTHTTSLLKMGSAGAPLLPFHPHSYSSSSLDLKRKDLLCLRSRSRRRGGRNAKRCIVPVARLFGPAIFESSKLKVLFLGVDGAKHPEKLPRAYTLTHSDITSKLTLAISHTINRAQVLKAFVHGDRDLFRNHPELEEAMVWVYFNSNLPEFNRVECWGPLREAASVGNRRDGDSSDAIVDQPRPCPAECNCCFPPYSLIPWPHNLHDDCPQDAAAAAAPAAAGGQELQQQQ